MAFIKERPDGKRQVNWRNLAGEITARTCPDLTSAKRLKIQVERALSEGRDWQPEVTGDEPLVEEVARQYILARRPKVSDDTLRMDGVYLDVFQRFVSLKFSRPSTRTVSILSRPLLEEYVGWLSLPETSLHGKKKREMVSITKFVRAAQLLWVWAENSDRWPGLVPRPRLLEDLPEARAGHVVAPTWEEMDLCVGACKGWQRKLATWLRYTGLRAGESMQFLWTDLDLQRGELTIRPEIDKKRLGRTIPLSTFILDEIATWGTRDGYLIETDRNEKTMRQREARSRDMAKAWRTAGVREVVWKKRPDHAFRRGFKSELLAAGAHPDAVDFLQGHQLGSGARGRYIDPTRLPMREALACMPAIGDSTPANVVKLPSKKRKAK